MSRSYAREVISVGERPARVLWEEGQESGRALVALGAAVALSALVLDRWIGEGLGAIFDVAFVLLCGWLALAVAPRDFFTVGVMPPLLMLGVFVLAAISTPEVLAGPHDSILQAVITGLADHAVALGIGYAAALGVLALRQRWQAHHPTTQHPAAGVVAAGAAGDQPSNLEGSPAPTRTTSG